LFNSPHIRLFILPQKPGADFHVTNSLVNKGDTVIAQFPAYQALYSTAEARGAKVKYWRMKPENEYKPDIDELKALIDEKTKLIVLNIPNNPTGAVISETQLKTILKWAEEQDFYVLCDEVYHALELTKGIIPPYGRNLSKKAISVGSMSKAYHVKGIWIIRFTLRVDCRSRRFDSKKLGMERLYFYQQHPLK